MFTPVNGFISIVLRTELRKGYAPFDPWIVFDRFRQHELALGFADTGNQDVYWLEKGLWEINDVTTEEYRGHDLLNLHVNTRISDSRFPIRELFAVWDLSLPVGALVSAQRYMFILDPGNISFFADRENAPAKQDRDPSDFINPLVNQRFYDGEFRPSSFSQYADAQINLDLVSLLRKRSVTTFTWDRATWR